MTRIGDHRLREELAAAELDMRLRHMRLGDLALNQVVGALRNLGPGDLPASVMPHLLRVACDVQRQALALGDEQPENDYGKALLTAVDRMIESKRSGS